MKWISKTPPQYVFKKDVWERETDYKIFIPDIRCNYWYAEDSERVDFPKKTRVMNCNDPA